MHDATLPPRIWVVGHCGAGKSTVAARLAARLGVEATHLDDIHWQPGWVEASRDEDAAALAPILGRPAWVVDGNYSFLREPNRERIDLYVWLDLPLSITFPRLLKRGLVRSLGRVPCCNGNYESFWRTFFHPDSLLLFSLRMDDYRRQQLKRHLAGRTHVRLRTQGAIDRWLRRAVPSPAARRAGEATTARLRGAASTARS